jgi:hypothetical protein
MDAIDRLGWADGVSVVAYGRRVGVRTNDPALLDRVCELLPPGWEPGFSPLVDHLFSLRVGGRAGRLRRYHLLYAGFTLLARSADLGVVLRELESRLHLYVGEFAANRVFVHAGAVGWGGRAVLLPGASRAGKSTLVAALLRAGAHYYSDEYAVLDPQGRLHPFARPLSLRSPGGATTRHPPEAFGGGAGREPLEVGLVAVTKYVAGARWRPRVLTAGQGVVALMPDTLAGRLDPDGVLGVLERAVAPAVVLQGSRGEADETADRLLVALAPRRSSCSRSPAPTG